MAPRRSSLISWLALPAFLVIGGLEVAAPWMNGRQPTWWIVIVCAAAALWILLIRPKLMAPRQDPPGD